MLGLTVGENEEIEENEVIETKGDWLAALYALNEINRRRHGFAFSPCP